MMGRMSLIRTQCGVSHFGDNDFDDNVCGFDDLMNLTKKTACRPKAKMCIALKYSICYKLMMMAFES